MVGNFRSALLNMPKTLAGAWAISPAAARMASSAGVGEWGLSRTMVSRWWRYRANSGAWRYPSRVSWGSCTISGSMKEAAVAYATDRRWARSYMAWYGATVLSSSLRVMA